MGFWERIRGGSRDRDSSGGETAPSRQPAATENDEWPPSSVAGYPVVMIGRKELLEEGFEFCGQRLTELFAEAGLSIRLDDESDPPGDVDASDEIIRWLWVDDVCLVEDTTIDYVEVAFVDGSTEAFYQLDWQLIEQLRQRYRHPADPLINFQLGGIDEGFLLILCRPDELGTVASDPEFPGFSARDLATVTSVTVQRY